MKTSNCMMLLAEHEEAANAYHNAETAAARKDALDEMNEIENELWRKGCNR